MAKIPSIALIPSGYKATKIYSVLPVDGNGDFTFDRGTSTDQTRVNKDGLIENVDQDVPRLDYLDGGCPSLLLEPASTNLYDYSEDLNLWGGSVVGLSISADSTLSPDGSVNADLVTEDTSTGSHSIRKLAGPTTTAGLDYSFSLFVKANGRDIVALSNDSGSASANAFFNLTSGTILSSTFDSASMVDYGNGWWRIETTHEATGTDDYDARIYTAIADGSFTHTGDGTSGFYLWGLQVEQKSYATSYIPTSGSTAPRAAETCNGAGSTDEINSQEGVLFVEAKKIAQTGTSMSIVLSDNTLNNRVQIIFHNSDTFRIFWDSSTASSYVGSTSLLDYDSYKRLALKYSSSEISLYLNGLLVSKSLGDYSFTSNTLNNLSFNISSGGENFYGRVKRLSVYDSALTENELEALTGFGSFSEMASYLSYS